MYYITNIIHNKYNNNLYQNALAILLIINMGLSMLFWNNPVNKCVIHWYDGTFGRISIVAFVYYIVCVKKIPKLQKIVFIFIFLLSMVYFYYSTFYSTKMWLCKLHIEYHFIFHVLITLGTMWAFI